MKNTTLFALAVCITLLAASSVTNAAVQCTTASIKIIADSCKKRDKGYKPGTHCIAKISAPKGYYFLAGEVNYSTKGTTHKEYVKEDNTPYSKVKSNMILSSALQTASVKVGCRDDRDNFKTFKTCHASAHISAKAYPKSCLAKQVQDALKSLGK